MSGASNLPSDFAERFWSKVDVGPPDQCWEWQAYRTKSGYGQIGVGSTLVIYAHRASVLLDGRDPSGAVVSHKCDNPPCVNPRHLRVGTASDNARDAVRSGKFYGKGRSRPQKLTEDDVRAIRRRAPNETRKTLALEYGVSTVSIGDVIRRKWWAWL